MEFGGNGNGKLDVSDVDLMEFLVGYNDDGDERGLPQPHQQQQQQQQQYQEISYSNNNSSTFPTSGVQQQPPPVTNFNVTWTVQLGHATANATVRGLPNNTSAEFCRYLFRVWVGLSLRLFVKSTMS